jgi:hypothetical protein
MFFLGLQRILKTKIMKTNFIATVLFLATSFANAQVLGNAGYADRNNSNYENINSSPIATSNGDFMTLKIKGIYNEKASSYIATFSVLQLGLNIDEVTNLMNEKISNIQFSVQKLNPNIEVVVDMISFLPRFETQSTSRLFRKKTYTEIPVGFALTKNLIFQYKKASDLDSIIAICAKNDVYDLAKVDYIINNLDGIKDKLQEKVLLEYTKKMKFYGVIKNVDLLMKEKSVNENFEIFYPLENYKNYTAFTKAHIPAGNDYTNHVEHNETFYFNGLKPKTHSFVINPDITEPTIQIIYEMTIVIDLRTKVKEAKVLPMKEKKSVYMVGSNVNVQKLDL